MREAPPVPPCCAEDSQNGSCDPCKRPLFLSPLRTPVYTQGGGGGPWLPHVLSGVSHLHSGALQQNRDRRVHARSLVSAAQRRFRYLLREV